MQVSRRSFMGGLLASTAMSSPPRFDLGEFLERRRNPPPRKIWTPGDYKATVTIVNDDLERASERGVPSYSFGWPFPQGAVPPGAQPKFTVAGETQPYSRTPPNASRYWEDG